MTSVTSFPLVPANPVEIQYYSNDFQPIVTYMQKKVQDVVNYLRGATPEPEDRITVEPPPPCVKPRGSPQALRRMGAFADVLSGMPEPADLFGYSGESGTPSRPFKAKNKRPSPLRNVKATRSRPSGLIRRNSYSSLTKITKKVKSSKPGFVLDKRSLCSHVIMRNAIKKARGTRKVGRKLQCASFQQ